MSENGCEKWHFLALSRVRIWITGQHTPTKNSQEYPPPRAFGQIAPYETSDQAKKNNFMVVGVQETDQTRG